MSHVPTNRRYVARGFCLAAHVCVLANAPPRGARSFTPAPAKRHPPRIGRDHSNDFVTTRHAHTTRPPSSRDLEVLETAQRARVRVYLTRGVTPVASFPRVLVINIPEQELTGATLMCCGCRLANNREGDACMERWVFAGNTGGTLHLPISLTSSTSSC